jgi:hypothetical protein
MKNLHSKILIIVIGFFVFSCKVNQVVLAEKEQAAVDTHRRVAILPFKVTFSENYKMNSRQSNRSNSWQEQERVAGLDLQKSCFLLLTKRAAKKQFGITVQDFLTTNKTLEKENVGFSQIKNFDKSTLARMLGVDAVIWGETSMELSQSSWAARNGMKSNMQLYDAQSGNLIWQNDVFQDATNRMDSPQDLAGRNVSTLINTLPYKTKKIDY